MIIGLNGYARSGKDEAASALVARGYTRVAFADALRNILYETDPYVPLIESESENSLAWVKPREVERLSFLVDDLGWDKAKETYPEVRRLLQRLGTEGGRNILGTNIWVKTALEGSDMQDIVVTDVRFKNEADYIKEQGGITVKIVREGVGPINSHISDNALEFYDFDYIINNNRGIKELHEEILMVAGFLKEPL